MLSVSFWWLRLPLSFAVLSKVKDNISIKSSTELRSAPLSNSTEQSPWGALERASEKSSYVLHDEVICKAVLIDSGQKKPAKRLQFTQSARGRQFAKHLDSQLSTSSGRDFFSTGFKTSSFSSFRKFGKGKKF